MMIFHIEMPGIFVELKYTEPKIKGQNNNKTKISCEFQIIIDVPPRVAASKNRELGSLRQNFINF